MRAASGESEVNEMNVTLRYAAWALITVLYVVPSNVNNTKAVMDIMDYFKFKSSTVEIVGALYNFVSGTCMTSFFAWILLG